MANIQANVAMEHYKHKELEHLSDKVKAMSLISNLINMAKKKKVAEKPIEQPIIEKVEVKEEKLAPGVRVIVSHNG
jgi:Na+-transporting methylmalonyl-CoA/oxaloacetate decarboxylase gamma subunit